MKKLFPLLLCLVICGCGSDSSSFSGTWDATFTNLDNDCPFTVVDNLDPLFPMTVTEDENGVFTVVAANGDVAVGGQGEGESISFSATSGRFGDFGSILPFACSSLSTIGFLANGDDEAKISLVISFTACAGPEAASPVDDCHAAYRWDGRKI